MTRPTTLTVIGILAIISGTIGVLCSPFAALNLINPATKEMIQAMGGTYKIFIIVQACLGELLGLLFLTCGIGLLQMKEWARKLGIGLSALRMVVAIAMTAVSMIFVLPKMQHLTGLSGPEMDQAMKFGAAIGGGIALVTIAICIVVYSLVIYFLTRPEVARACQTDPVEQAYAGSL